MANKNSSLATSMSQILLPSLHRAIVYALATYGARMLEPTCKIQKLNPGFEAPGVGMYSQDENMQATSPSVVWQDK